MSAEPVTGVGQDVLLARAFLNRIAEPASVPLWWAVRQAGPLEVARAIRAGQAGDLIDGGVSDAVLARAAEADPYADLEAAERHGIRMVVPESQEWPHFAFSALERAGERRAVRWLRGDKKQSESGEPVPPLALWIRGPLELSSVGVRSVALVGARNHTDYGAYVTDLLARGLSEAGFAIVSGGALGIDGAAHRATLDVGGETVLVSAGGLDEPYPPAHAGLFERVAESGLCTSESPPGSAPRRRRFLTRNRLIAALGTGTVVVEAAYRSGALNTATHCTTLGRMLMAVPGPITARASAGCHRILARDEGRARLVTCVNDVLELVGGARDARTEPDPERRGAFDLASRLDTVEALDRQVFDGFPARAWTDPGRLAAATGLSVINVMRSLPSLELAGLVESSVQGYRVSSRLWSSVAGRTAGALTGAETRSAGTTP